MKTRRFLVYLLTLMLLLSLLPAAQAAGIPGEEKLPDDAGYGFSYAFVSPTTIEITAYFGCEAEVKVPSTIDGYTVVGIRDFHTKEGYSLDNEFVQKVILPETVTYIADGAFSCSDDWAAKTSSQLREIVLPDGLKTIGAGAFFNNSKLQSIEIPASVTEIGNDAFAACTELSSVTFKGENTFLWGGAFGTKRGSFAKKLDELYLEWAYAEGSSDFFIWEGLLLGYKGTSKTPVIPDTVTVIGAWAFGQSDITGVTIPSSVKLIGQYAFYECESLTSVDIPGSVERIDDSAFAGCKGLTSVTLHEGLKVIGDGGLRECEGLTRLDLPDGLTTLEDTALYDCTGIEHFTFPSSLVDMEASSIYTSKWYEGLADGAELYCGSVFLGCKNDVYPSKLTVRSGTKTVRIEKNDNLSGVNELTLPGGLESLTITLYTALSDCGITKLTVPESVNYINVRNLGKLTDLKLPQTAVLESTCFDGCYRIKNLTIPKGNRTLNGVCVGRTENLILPDDVLEVRGPISNGDTFNNNDGNSYLKSIDLKNVRILTNGALSSSVALETVTLPDSLVTLGDGVFRGCARLRSVKGGKNVRQIGDGCFGGCTALTDFGDLEKNVTRVGSLAFLNCGWFHDQPNGVVYFGKAAYAYKGTMPEGTVLQLRDGTVSVTYEFLAGQTELNPSFDQPNLAGLILPQSCKYVDGYAFAGAKNMKFIDLGGVQYIGTEAFNNSACESIVLPDSVRFVGSNAFSAPNIKAIHLNNGLRVLDEGAFFTYGKGKGVTIPASVTYIGAQAFGYCPVDPDNPFDGLTKIDGFVIRGTAGTVAQTYADQNEFSFVTTACTAHQLVTETIAAICQTGGFTRETCSVCGYSNVTARSAATGHKAVANDAIEATCTRPGYTGGTHCSACGVTLTQPTQTPALGHDEVVATEEYEYSAYYGMIRHYCRRCELRWYETNGSGHVHDYSYQTVVTDPTCIAEGYTTHICSCGESYRDSYVAELGHNYVDGVCTRCGNVQGTCDGGKNCPSRIFSDVDTTKWYHLGIDYMVTHGYMAGTGDGSTFSPNLSLTREMLAQILYAKEGKPEIEFTGRFPDVVEGRWYAKAVEWAASQGYVAGYANGRFGVGDAVTREQLSVILYAYAGRPEADPAQIDRFPDRAAVAGWSAQAMAWAVQDGLVSGTGDGRLAPKMEASRAQFAVIFRAYLTK